MWQSIFDLFIVPQLDYSTMFRKSNVNITVFFFLVLKYRKVITIKSLKSKKKKLAVTLFYYVSREIWLASSKRLICIDQSRFYIFLHYTRIQKYLTINHLQAEPRI